MMNAKTAAEILKSTIVSYAPPIMGTKPISIRRCEEIADFIEQQTRELTVLRQRIKGIEWHVSQGETETEYQCTTCGGRKYYGGHKPDCWMAQEISKLEA
jgi:hypothetical protein